MDRVRLVRDLDDDDGGRGAVGHFDEGLVELAGDVDGCGGRDGRGGRGRRGGRVGSEEAGEEGGQQEAARGKGRSGHRKTSGGGV